jgi:hypothetical protein
LNVTFGYKLPLSRYIALFGFFHEGSADISDCRPGLIAKISLYFIINYFLKGAIELLDFNSSSAPHLLSLKQYDLPRNSCWLNHWVVFLHRSIRELK